MKTITVRGRRLSIAPSTSGRSVVCAGAEKIGVLDFNPDRGHWLAWDAQLNPIGRGGYERWRSALTAIVNTVDKARAR